MFSKLWLGLLSIIVLGLLWLVSPYLGSAYYLDKGGRLLDTEDPRTAMDYLERAVALNPDNTLAYRWLTKAHLQLDQPDQAREPARQMLQLAPNNPLVQLEAGDVYDRLGEFEQAITHYEAGQVGDRQLQLAVNYLQLADLLWAEGKHDQVVTIWQDRLPGTGFASLYANWRLYRYYANQTEAANVYQDSIRYFPLKSIALSPDIRLNEYQHRAIVGVATDGLWEPETLSAVIAYRVWQDQSQATEDLLQALLAGDQTNGDLGFFLGEMYHRRGEWQAAQRAYKQVLELDPEYAPAYLRLGMIAEAKPLGNPAEAAGWYEHYHKLIPDDLLGIKKLGDVYEVLDNPAALILQNRFKIRTDDRQIIADLLGLDPHVIELGENVLSNGNFEIWPESHPSHWQWYDMSTQKPFNRAIFAGGKDTLATIELNGARVDGLWLQHLEDRSPARGGWWYDGEIKPEVKQESGYALSFFYRTESLPDQSLQLWFEHSSQYLPNTNGAWQYKVILLQDLDADSKIQPLFRIFNSGRFWIDGVTLRPIVLANN